MCHLFGIDLAEVIVYYQQPDITMDSDIDFRLQMFFGPIESTLADFAKSAGTGSAAPSRAVAVFSWQVAGAWRDRYFFG